MIAVRKGALATSSAGGKGLLSSPLGRAAVAVSLMGSAVVAQAQCINRGEVNIIDYSPSVEAAFVPNQGETFQALVDVVNESQVPGIIQVEMLFAQADRPQEPPLLLGVAEYPLPLAKMLIDVELGAVVPNLSGQLVLQAQLSSHNAAGCRPIADAIVFNKSVVGLSTPEHGLVDSFYRGLFGRAPSAEELTQGAQALADGGAALSQWVDAIFDDDDYQQRVLPMARLYAVAFGRIPDSAGLAYWSGEFRNRPSDHLTIAADFADSAEFALRFGADLDDESYVRQLYRNILGREAEAAGFSYWLAELQSGRLSRAGLLVAFAAAEEYISAADSLVVATIVYRLLLGRDPTAEELAAAVAMPPAELALLLAAR